MARVKVPNVPDDLYAALRRRARRNGRSVSAEVREILQENFPTAKELRRRQAFFRELKAMPPAFPPDSGPFPAAKEAKPAGRKSPSVDRISCHSIAEE